MAELSQARVRYGPKNAAIASGSVAVSTFADAKARTANAARTIRPAAFSTSAVDMAEREAPRGGVHFVRCNIVRLPENNDQACA